MREKTSTELDARRQHAIELRRWLHQHPELAFTEAETATRVVSELERLAIPAVYSGPVAGVIGRISVDPALPTVAIRAVPGIPACYPNRPVCQ